MKRFQPVIFAACLGLAVLSTPAALRGQRPLFKNGVELVPLTVTVTDQQGRYVDGLTSSDFHVFEEGVAQSLAFFTGDRVPVDLALVLDVSASMVNHMSLIKRAATALVETLQADDRAAVSAIRKYIAVPQPLTADKTRVLAAIRSLISSGQTSLYDGVYIALKDLERARGSAEVRKQVVVLLSDGLDSGSHISLEDVSELATVLGISIYVIAAPSVEAWAGPKPLLARAQFDLRQLGRESGGRLFTPRAIEELPAISAAIADELANQYELAYVPHRTTAARGFRRVVVQVANAIARTRAGYFAAARP